jgi:hypothetical protein
MANFKLSENELITIRDLIIISAAVGLFGLISLLMAM